MDNWVSIHRHCDGSLLDGMAKPKAAAQRACELQQCAVGITEHGNCFTHWEFYLACKKAGIKPLLGTEFYVAPAIIDDDGKKIRKRYHITALAMTNEGLSNMYKLTTIASTQFFYKPVVTVDQICEHNAGLILTSGCYASIISQALLNDNDEEAEYYIKKFRGVFGDRFYIELQDSGVPGQPKITEKLRKLAKKHSIKKIVTDDSHYVFKHDAIPHEVLLALNTNNRLSDKPIYEGGKRFAFSTNEYYMKDGKILADEGWLKDELEVTLEIAGRCDVEIDCSPKMPVYPYVPKGLTSMAYLKKLIKQRWNKRNLPKDKNSVYHKRIKRELADIKLGGIADYFLMVWAYIEWAFDNDILVGPSRGSCGGSLVSYVLGISQIDPIKWGLYWERFWNVGRIGVGMPDIDSDFPRSRRADVIDFVYDCYGKDRVLPVITMSKMTSKMALRDVGRTIGIPVSTMDKITCCVPGKVSSLEDAIEKSPDLAAAADKYKKLFSITKALQNTTRHASKHASATVILSEPYTTGNIPLHWDARSKSLVTGMDYHALDKMGYLKLDMLSVAVLDVLDIVKKASENKNASI